MRRAVWTTAGILACLVALAIAIGRPPVVAGPGAAAAAQPDCGPAWVTGWQAAVQPAVAEPGLAGATIRMIVQPQVTGSQVRITLSNAAGSGPLTVGAASAAWADGGRLVTGTIAAVPFAGRPDVVVPAGAEVVSDPVPLVAQPGRPLAVSLHLTGVPRVLSRHTIALQTSYRSSTAGDRTIDPAALDLPVLSWLVLSAVEVLAPRPVNALVAVGDSITDGLGSPVDGDARWTDALAGALTGAGGSALMVVRNAGISGDRLLSPNPAGGDPVLARLARDTAGATDVVLHIGTNDIAAGAPPGNLIDGLRAAAAQARAAGMRVFLTTVTPSMTAAHGTPAAVATRDAVNTWVRAHGREHADGVFDFAAAVADSRQPGRLAPQFDGGDGLHLSAAGYRALAGAVDPARLSGSPCLADSSPARVVVSGE